jgi:hypothetical protein
MLYRALINEYSKLLNDLLKPVGSIARFLRSGGRGLSIRSFTR